MRPVEQGRTEQVSGRFFHFLDCTCNAEILDFFRCCHSAEGKFINNSPYHQIVRTNQRNLWHHCIKRAPSIPPYGMGNQILIIITGQIENSGLGLGCRDNLVQQSFQQLVEILFGGNRRRNIKKLPDRLFHAVNCDRQLIDFDYVGFVWFRGREIKPPDRLNVAGQCCKRFRDISGDHHRYRYAYQQNNGDISCRPEGSTVYIRIEVFVRDSHQQAVVS